MPALKSLLVLAGAFLLLRTVGAIMRVDPRLWIWRLLGWILCAAGAWVAAGAVGAWFPIWPAVVIGGCGYLASRLGKGRLWGIVVDLLVVTLAGFYSIPPLAAGKILAVALSVLVVGFLLDHWIGQTALTWPAKVRSGLGIGFVIGLAIMLSLFIWLVCAWVRGSPVDTAFRSPGSLPNLALAAKFTPKRITLETGAIAWLEQPHSDRPAVCAVFFHGANREGSDQKAAWQIRRALLEAGCAVLSVDHLGYGASPIPAALNDLAAWDPSPTTLAAVKVAAHLPGIQDVLLVGHSMGVSDVLRVMDQSRIAGSAVLFGAGAISASPRWDLKYWTRRFYDDRRMTQRLPEAFVQKIYLTYYDNIPLAEALPKDHPPIHFVSFQFENPSTRASEEALFSRLPEPNVSRSWLGFGHYLDIAQMRGGILLGDSRATRACVRLFKSVIKKDLVDKQSRGRKTWASRPLRVATAATAGFSEKQ